MKTKNNGTSQASKTKTVIMRITAVKIRDTTTGSNSSAFGFLQEAGFQNISSDGHHLKAVAPEGDRPFFLEYESKTETDIRYALFRIVRVYRGTPLEIDRGEIHFAYPAVNGFMELSAKGEEASDWEMTVEPSALEAIPKKGAFCAVDSPVAQAVNGRAEGSLPSTAEGLIRLELERRGEMAENPEARKARGGSISGMPRSLFSERKLGPWPHNQLIRDYMKEHHGDDQRVSAISEALHAIMAKENTKMSYLALRFQDYNTNISLLLSVCNLHPDLKPLLDKPHGHMDRLSPQALYVLVRIPIAEQVGIWEEAVKVGNGRNVFIVNELKRLGDKHLRQFNDRCPWSKRYETIATPSEAVVA